MMEDVRVLIVDDDPAIREIVAAVLQRSGVVTDLAGDGTEAVALMQERAYAAIVLDLLMPRMHGGEVLQFMKEHNITTPVIVMSAATASYPLDPTLVRVTMNKPIEVHDLRSVVDAVLRASAPPSS